MILNIVMSYQIILYYIIYYEKIMRNDKRENKNKNINDSESNNNNNDKNRYSNWILFLEAL